MAKNTKEKVKIIADNRENSSEVLNFIRNHNVDLETKNLEVGDYIVSDRVCIERKTVPDFLQSIIDQRIFKQAESMISSFERPLLILEGNPENLFNSRNIHENAIRGVLSSLCIDYRLPIIWTYSQRETAAQVYWLAYREQFGEKRELQIRCKTKKNGMREQQEFLIAGLPLISNKMSRKLLKHFKTPKKLFNAKTEKLMKVENIGQKKAEDIRKLLDSEYKPKKK